MTAAILLVEDSPDDEALFRRVLTQNRVLNSLVVVRDGGEALAYLQEAGRFADHSQYPRPGILFIDLKMPGVDGFAVLEWLAAHPESRHGLLVIALSQLEDSKQIQRAYDLGADSFLPKPFSTEDLKNLIHHFAKHWHRQDD